MNLILTPEQFATYRDVGSKLDKDKINECIKLSQNIDLYDVLGDFLFEVIENSEETDFNDLMSGSTFTIDNQDYHQEGIRSVLSDLVYSRYVYLVNTNFTPFGATQKFGQDSSPVDRNLLKDISKQAQIDASIKFQMVDKFLKSNRTQFPRYKQGNNPNINTNSQRFSVIK